MCIQKAMMGTTKRKMSSVDAPMDATKDATTAECNFIATKIIVIKAPTVETDSPLMKTRSHYLIPDHQRALGQRPTKTYRLAHSSLNMSERLLTLIKSGRAITHSIPCIWKETYTLMPRGLETTADSSTIDAKIKTARFRNGEGARERVLAYSANAISRLEKNYSADTRGNYHSHANAERSVAYLNKNKKTISYE